MEGVGYVGVYTRLLLLCSPRNILHYGSVHHIFIYLVHLASFLCYDTLIHVHLATCRRVTFRFT